MDKTNLKLVVNAFNHSAYYQIPVESLKEGRERAISWDLDAEIFIIDGENNELERIKEFEDPERRLTGSEILNRMPVDQTSNTMDISYPEHLEAVEQVMGNP